MNEFVKILKEYTQRQKKTYLSHKYCVDEQDLLKSSENWFARPISGLLNHHPSAWARHGQQAQLIQMQVADIWKNIYMGSCQIKIGLCPMVWQQKCREKKNLTNNMRKMYLHS